MKKSPPPPAAAPDGFWRPIALFSVVANLALITWLVFHPAKAAPASATPSAPAEIAPAPVAAPASSSTPTPREFAPYAALGSFMAENNRIADLGWNEAQFRAFLDGMRASYEGRGLPLDDQARKLRDDISQRVQKMLATEQPDPAEDYFRSLREKEGVSRTASGLHYRITEPGAGARPTKADTVVVSFAARLPDGQSIPALSRARVKVAVKDLLPGLAEAVQLLPVGGKCLAYLPPSLAFTDADWPPQLPKQTPLVFFLELHEIVGAP